MQEIFSFDRIGISPRGRVLGKFRATGAKSLYLDRLKSYGIHLSQSIFHEEHEIRER
jgi:pilus assembly protein CpaF